MVAFNFQKQFADDVESGKKCSTIRRAGKKLPPKIGDELQLYAGMMTKNCRLLRKAKCTDVNPVLFTRKKGKPIFCIGVIIGTEKSWIQVVASEVNKMALADGFKSTADFFDYFFGDGEEDFCGFLIEWEAIN